MNPKLKINRDDKEVAILNPADNNTQLDPAVESLPFKLNRKNKSFNVNGDVHAFPVVQIPLYPTTVHRLGEIGSVGSTFDLITT